MRILLLATSFNSLTQRVFLELTQRRHAVSVEFDVNDAVTTEAVRLARPDLVIAPFLKRKIPEAVWSKVPCLVVHPGPVGDQGPAALDHAILSGATRWGVTVFQANGTFDAGDVWAHRSFEMRQASKSSLYRDEVSAHAVSAVLEAVQKFEVRQRPEPLFLVADTPVFRPAIEPEARRIDWAQDSTATVVAKIRSADGAPGVPDTLFGEPCRLFHAFPETVINGKRPGEIIGWRDGAILRATCDGAVWIGAVSREPKPGERAVKVPTTHAFADEIDGLKELTVSLTSDRRRTTYQEIVYREVGPVGYLTFDFHNGAMSTDQCRRLLEAYAYALSRPTKVLGLLGGRDFWSNGMHLGVIETSKSPADESWANINAIDDLAREIILTDDKVTIAALRGNAGAGGVFLALAADFVVARQGIVLSPHYKNMGNLFGSEYWTYLLPKRVGEARARTIMETRLPLGTTEAQDLGLIDAVLSPDRADFTRGLWAMAESLANEGSYRARLAEKRWRRWQDEQRRPLERYRADELDRMRLNFYGFDPSYHVARYNFITKVPHSRTPLHLAKHRAATSDAAKPTLSKTA
jgi:putative two-component system hydrogenase maturation factor HypX/HoxX